MKGVILAGGTGSRLLPLTRVTNKHLLPVGESPMIYHSVTKLVEAGIVDILIVTGVEHMGDIVRLLGSGSEFGCQFTYRVQDAAGGIAQALLLAESFCASEPFVVILGDNIFESELTSYVSLYQKDEQGCLLLLKEVHDPSRYGVATLENDRIMAITEKPQNPASSYAVTGIYFYRLDVFEVIKTLKPSLRGELEISDVNQYYVDKGTCYYRILDGWWTDAGTFESLKLANDYLSHLS